MTGHGAGLCEENRGQQAAGPPPGAEFRGGGFRRGGRGGGRGHRRRFYASGLPGWARTDAETVGPGACPSSAGLGREEELEALKQQATSFQGALDGIQQRIETLEAESPEEQSTE